MTDAEKIATVKKWFDRGIMESNNKTFDEYLQGVAKRFEIMYGEPVEPDAVKIYDAMQRKKAEHGV